MVLPVALGPVLLYLSCQTVLTSYTQSIGHDRQTPGLYRIRLASIQPSLQFAKNSLQGALL